MADRNEEVQAAFQKVLERLGRIDFKEHQFRYWKNNKSKGRIYFPVDVKVQISRLHFLCLCPEAARETVARFSVKEGSQKRNMDLSMDDDELQMKRADESESQYVVEYLADGKFKWAAVRGAMKSLLELLNRSTLKGETAEATAKSLVCAMTIDHNLKTEILKFFETRWALNKSKPEKRSASGKPEQDEPIPMDKTLHESSPVGPSNESEQAELHAKGCTPEAKAVAEWTEDFSQFFGFTKRQRFADMLDEVQVDKNSCTGPCPTAPPVFIQGYAGEFLHEEECEKLSRNRSLSFGHRTRAHCDYQHDRSQPPKSPVKVTELSCSQERPISPSRRSRECEQDEPVILPTTLRESSPIGPSNKSEQEEPIAKGCAPEAKAVAEWSEAFGQFCGFTKPGRFADMQEPVEFQLVVKNGSIEYQEETPTLRRVQSESVLALDRQCCFLT